MSEKRNPFMEKFLSRVNKLAPVASPQATRTPEAQQKLRDDVDKLINPQPSEGTTPQAERPDSPYNAVSEMLGKYLNTMVADLGLENKGQYLRDLFSQYEKEVSLAEVQWRARAVAPVETRLNLAAAVMKHFDHCRCDQQIKKTPPCLYCQAKEESDALSSL